jgi:hypothetical protein
MKRSAVRIRVQVAACVGVALQVCEHATDHGNDLGEAHRLAARFVDSAFRNLDVGALSPEPAAKRRSKRSKG